MKRLSLLLLPLLLSSTPSFALVGGPWGQNTFGGSPGDVNGTYQGIVRGKNVSGILIFGTGSTSAGANTTTQSQNFNFFTGASTNTTTSTATGGLGTSGNEGRAAIFIDGYVVLSQVSAVIDLSGRRIAGMVEGSRVKSVQTISRQIATTSTTPGQPVIQTINGNTVSVPGSATTSTAITTQTYTFTDVLDVSGSFDTRINSTFPQITFAGGGKFTVSQSIGVQQVGIDFTDTPLSNGTDVATTTTELVPILATNEVDVDISGVKTSQIPPSFPGGVTVDQPSVK